MDFETKLWNRPFLSQDGRLFYMLLCHWGKMNQCIENVWPCAKMPDHRTTTGDLSNRWVLKVWTKCGRYYCNHFRVSNSAELLCVSNHRIEKLFCFKCTLPITRVPELDRKKITLVDYQLNRNRELGIVIRPGVEVGVRISKLSHCIAQRWGRFSGVRSNITRISSSSVRGPSFQLQEEDKVLFYD